MPLIELIRKIVKIGYARISINNQDIGMQINALKTFGCEKIYKDTTSSFDKRPKLELMNSQLCSGDIVVVWKLNRIVKSLFDLINLFNTYKERDIYLISIQDNINTYENRSILEIVSVIAELDRETNSEKVISGLEIAKKRGRNGGRPKGLSHGAIIKAKKVKQLYEDEKIKVKDIAIRLNIGKTTLYRYLKYNGEKLPATNVYRNQKSNNFISKENIKEELFEKLITSKAFWSYSNVNIENISDNLLIQKVMENLDLPDIKKLFILFNKNYVRNIWKKELILQDPYFRSLNILIAKLFFNIKKPESYIRNVRREYIKSVS